MLVSANPTGFTTIKFLVLVLEYVDTLMKRVEKCNQGAMREEIPGHRPVAAMTCVTTVYRLLGQSHIIILYNNQSVISLSIITHLRLHDASHQDDE